MHKHIYSFFHKIYHTKYHGIYRHAKKLFVFDLALLGLAIIILAGGIFFFFWKPGITDLIDLSISLGNNRIKSGEYVHLTVDYANKSKYKLENISLGLRLPNGFTVDRTKTPESTFSKTSIFTAITTLDPGAKGQVEIFGWLWSVPNQEERITAYLAYEPHGLNRTEQKVSVYAARLPESIITGKLEMATTTFPNTPTQFTYTITNTGSETVNNISLINNWLTNIIAAKDQNFSLPAGGYKVISGTLTTPNQGGNYSLEITPQILINNYQIAQKIVKQTSNNISPNIESSVSFVSTPAYAEPGQVIPLAIRWNNKSNFKLDNLQMKLTANQTKVVDWAKTARENHATAAKDGLILDTKTRTNFSNGNPGSNDSFTINLYLLPTFAVTGEKIYLELIPTMEAGLAKISTQKFTQEGSRARLPLASEVRLASEARYYTPEGDQLGRGSLPPQVKKTTKYWVFIKISNTSNQINNAKLITSLANGVTLTGKQSVTLGSDIIYDSASRKISWSNDAIPANSQVGIYFEVAVTPTAAQLGQNINLTNSMQFGATDDFVNKTFNLSTAGVTNILNANDRGHIYGSQVTE
ncbi:MAG: hypothetical protein WC526_01815 [Patescibacteria group bacterium]